MGVIGLSNSLTRNNVAEISFYNLIFSFLICLIACKDLSFKFLSILFSIALFGLIVEWIGVHTSLLFGSYSYGNNLGFKFFEVPFIIGLNWVVLVITTASLSNLIPTKKIVKVIIASLLMLLIDFFIEPVAIQLDYWSWDQGTIPWFNYFCWFVIALAMQGFYFKFELAKTNNVHSFLYVIQLLFFITLNITL